MMSSSKANNKERCIRCTKTFLTAKNRLKCTKCTSFLHQRCSRVARQEHLENKQGVFRFVCRICTEYTCIRCAKPVYYGQNAVLCNGCDKWIHKKCAGLTNEQYYKLQSGGNEETWYCGPCNSLMFPFFNVSNVDLKKILLSSKSNKPRLKNTTTTIETKQKNIHCSVFYKKTSNCHLLIHKKYSGLNQRDIIKLKKASKYRWECSTCLTTKETSICILI